MKKIIFISNVDTGQGMSGGSRIYFEFLKNWDTFFDATIFASAGTKKRLLKENINNIRYIVTTKDDNSNTYSILGIFKHSFMRAKSGVRSIKENLNVVRQSDYIYSVSDFYPDFLPAFYAKLKNKKIIWIAGYYLFAPWPFSKESPYKGKNGFRGLLYWLMQRSSYFIIKKYADIVFVTSEPDVNKFVTKKRSRDKVIVIQGGVDTTESEKYLKSGDIVPAEIRKYDACFVGRFHYQKGVVGLVEIWEKVCQTKPDAKLAMIGNGSLENEVSQKIKKFGLENNIDLIGFADGSKKFEIFKQSKIIVHPAIYDSGGMAAAEGMAWGLPGVSYDLEALETYYPKGMLKTETNNQTEFADNITRLLNDKKLYIKASNEALKLIRNVWDWKKRSEKIINLIEASNANK